MEMESRHVLHWFIGFARAWHVCLLSAEPQVPQEACADVLGVPQPGWDERRGGAALQLSADAEEADAERRLRGERRRTARGRPRLSGRRGETPLSSGLFS